MIGVGVIFWGRGRSFFFFVGIGLEVNDLDEVLLRLEEEAVVGVGFIGDFIFNSELVNRLIWCIIFVK